MHGHFDMSVAKSDKRWVKFDPAMSLQKSFDLKLMKNNKDQPFDLKLIKDQP